VGGEVDKELNYLREQNEILLTSVHIMAGFSDPHVRMFAKQVMRRAAVPDGATPFDDYRHEMQILKNRSSELRTVLARLTDLVGRKQFMDAAAVPERYEDVLTLEEVTVLELTLKEARRCLEENE
jgi:hypothetical protein